MASKSWGALRLGVALAALMGSWSSARAQKSPEQELASLRPAEGLAVELFAAEPLLTNPTAIDVDTQGRVWVAEIEFYRRFANRPPADRIRVLEDTDGDGRADRSTIFAEGVYNPMSICVAWPQVFVATSPDLWVYEDRDNDLKADGPPRKLLTGFGGYNHDHGAHSLVLGPDHKWWMSHGDGGFDLTGTDGSKAAFRWGGLLRGELDGSQLELVAQNFRNPYEPAVSSLGEVIQSDNDNDGNQSARICWIMEGGDYGWFGGPPERVAPGTPFGESWHFRGHLPGFVPATLVTGFGSPAGMCFYEGDAFGADLRDVAWHCDPGPREVRIYPHVASGYGMRGSQRVVLRSEGDNYFRPVDVCAAPDGTLLVADWYDGGVGGHAYNDPHRGRIFRLRPSDTTAARREKPGPYATIDDALVALASPNLATCYLARERVLAAGDTAVPRLTALFGDAGQPLSLRARALWLLDRLGPAGRATVVAALDDPQGDVRALSVRILRRRASEHADLILLRHADDDPRVRREVLLALRELSSAEAEETLARLAVEYDGQDRYLLEAIHIAAGGDRHPGRRERLLAALDARVAWNVERVGLLHLLSPSRAVELLVRELSRDGAAESARQALQVLAGIQSPLAVQAAWQAVTITTLDDATRLRAMEIVAANLRGPWRDLPNQARFAEQLAALLDDPALQSAALELIGEHGWRQFAPRVLALAGDRRASVERRCQALRVAGRLRAADSAAPIARWLDDPEQAVAADAARALADLQDLPQLRRLLQADGTSSAMQQTILEQMMTTTGGALAAFRLLEQASPAPRWRDLVMERASRHPDAHVRGLWERTMPEDQRPVRLGAAIQAGDILQLSGDVDRGQRIFAESTAAQCKNCHSIDGKGQSLGPDLAQIGRKYERATLLETILDPSKAIAPEYVPYLVETDDGLLYAGFLVEKTEKQIVVKDAQNRRTTLPTEHVTTLEPQTKSLMPELVLRDVTAQDAADLLAYLMTLRGPESK